MNYHNKAKNINEIPDKFFYSICEYLPVNKIITFAFDIRELYKLFKQKNYLIPHILYF